MPEKRASWYCTKKHSVEPVPVQASSTVYKFKLVYIRVIGKLHSFNFYEEKEKSDVRKIVKQVMSGGGNKVYSKVTLSFNLSEAKPR